MAQVDEAVRAALTFIKYVKFTNPIDGLVYWIKGDLLSPSAIYNAMRYNSVPYDTATSIVTAAPVLECKGSLHYATRIDQGEAETFSTNDFVFTAEKEVSDLNAVGPTMMYLSEWRGLRFAFSSTDNFFQEAGLWHYHGHSVFADMATQIVDDVNALVTRQVASNSIPIWLSLNGYTPQPWEVFGNPVTLYPSFLLPLNLEPPFASVHVVPESTEALQGAPFYDKTWGHIQLVKETVRVTTYGLDNGGIFDFVDFMLQWTANNPTIMGIMNSPVPRDEKRPQVEFQTIAQKKVIDFEVNYYQNRARDIARQLIKDIFIDFYVDDLKFTTEAIHIPS